MFPEKDWSEPVFVVESCASRGQPAAIECPKGTWREATILTADEFDERGNIQPRQSQVGHSDDVNGLLCEGAPS
jgi:hypothetical protein